MSFCGICTARLHKTDPGSAKLVWAGLLQIQNCNHGLSIADRLHNALLHISHERMLADNKSLRWHTMFLNQSTTIIDEHSK